MGKPENKTDRLATAFGRTLDQAISHRNDQRRRFREEYARQGKSLSAFLARAELAMKQAVTAISDRSESLRFDGPAVLEVSTESKRDDQLHGTIEVQMNRPPRPGADTPRQYRWEMTVSVLIKSDGRAVTHFRIYGQRDGWGDAWGCDIPAKVCDPSGLTLGTSGDEVARRFMSWFTTYMT